VPWYNRLPWWANLLIAVFVLAILVLLYGLVLFVAF
jgi:hypothetical protein